MDRAASHDCRIAKQFHPSNGLPLRSERQAPNQRSTLCWSGTLHCSHLAPPKYLPFLSNFPPARSRMRARTDCQTEP